MLSNGEASDMKNTMRLARVEAVDSIRAAYEQFN
jgi:hypothetical protein